MAYNREGTFAAVQARLKCDLTLLLTALSGTLPHREIARKIGVRHDTVYYWMRRLGLNSTKSQANLTAWADGRWDRSQTAERLRTVNQKYIKGRPSHRRG